MTDRCSLHGPGEVLAAWLFSQRAHGLHSSHRSPPQSAARAPCLLNAAEWLRNQQAWIAQVQGSDQGVGAVTFEQVAPLNLLAIRLLPSA